MTPTTSLTSYLVTGFRYDATVDGDCAEDAALRAARAQYGAGVSVEWSAPKRGDLGVWDALIDGAVVGTAIVRNG
jgi:hypothetical protein